MSRPHLRFEWKLQDLWVGFYWKVTQTCEDYRHNERVDVWVCLLPCIPLRVTWYRKPWKNRKDGRA